MYFQFVFCRFLYLRFDFPRRSTFPRLHPTRGPRRQASSCAQPSRAESSSYICQEPRYIKKYQIYLILAYQQVKSTSASPNTLVFCIWKLSVGASPDTSR